MSFDLTSAPVPYSSIIQNSHSCRNTGLPTATIDIATLFIRIVRYPSKHSHISIS
ncbi:hypothetical protein PJ912_21690 [Pectobacterium colocasium]|uniref:hypothetical protein n=1 Tax=Pectobacterium colocasium TaxID=2878098 RepID=UPI0027A691D0|nr:hypothetical protein KXZ65_20325 [Pectobacterium sp. PL152]WED68383.1 hypothetical protein PJ912_21690 [Pectobacterium colocasium]